MPYSANGIGTGLIAASRKRKVNGAIQFDAIEAGIFLGLPFLPYKALHILDIGPGNGMGERYRFVPLRLSARIVLKAFLNRWGTCGTIFGLIFVVLLSIILPTMPRPANKDDYIFVAVFATMLVVGIVCKIAWLLLTRKDERIKDVIGPHEQGSSDPLEWLPDRAEAVINTILQQRSLSSLTEVARRAMTEGKQSDAALCLRLAMRDPNNYEAQDMMNRLLAEQ
jgi:hypothetical protein